MAYKMRVYRVTKKQKSMEPFEKRLERLKHHKKVIITKGYMKNFRGVITGAPIVSYYRKRFLVPVRIKDAGNAIRGALGTSTFWYDSKSIKPDTRRRTRYFGFPDTAKYRKEQYWRT